MKREAFGTALIIKSLVTYSTVLPSNLGGFIGTVIGLSDAVGGFGKVVSQGADIEELKTALGGVTGGLSVAFETTLIALVLALIVQLFAKFVNNQEELFMDECADYCNRNIVAKMKNINLTEEIN